jgi:hypothetical protein
MIRTFAFVLCLVASTAQAQSVNQVRVLQDGQVDSGIEAILYDSQDVARLTAVWGTEASHVFSDTRARVELQVSCGVYRHLGLNACRVAYLNSNASFRQQYDELIKDYTLPTGLAARVDAEWTQAQPEALRRECRGIPDCLAFLSRSFVSLDGRLELRCNTRVRDDGSLAEPYCGVRFDIRDIVRAERAADFRGKSY